MRHWLNASYFLVCTVEGQKVLSKNKIIEIWQSLKTDTCVQRGTYVIYIKTRHADSDIYTSGEKTSSSYAD
jgi:hypothetical protein